MNEPLEFLKKKFDLSRKQINTLKKYKIDLTEQAVEKKCDNFYNEYGMTNKQLKMAVRSAPNILVYTSDTIAEKYNYFKDEFELSKEEFAKLIEKHSNILLQGVDTLREKTKFYENKLDLNKAETKQFMLRHPDFYTYNQETLGKRIDEFLSLGISKEVIIKKPFILSLSTPSLMKKLAICDYYGFDREKFLMSSAFILSEKKLFARGKMVNSKNVKDMAMTHADFEKKYKIDENLASNFEDYPDEFNKFYQNFVENNSAGCPRQIDDCEEIEL